MKNKEPEKDSDPGSESFGDISDDESSDEVFQDDLSSVMSKAETKSLLGTGDEDHHVLLNLELDISLFKFFQLFFSDTSEFDKKYHASRGDQEYHREKWKNSEEHGLIRQITCNFVSGFFLLRSSSFLG